MAWFDEQISYKNIMSTALIRMIKVYQFALSLLIGHCCRFEPSCSNYALEAIQRYGTLKGCRLMLCRVLRCHPWHPGGVDPVP